VRICSLSDIQKLLEEALAQEHPVSAHLIVACLGYANDGYLQRKFPDLCRAIRQKIAAQREPRLSVMERVLKNALRKTQVPTLIHLCRQLGYSTSLVVRYHFPQLCDEILCAAGIFASNTSPIYEKRYSSYLPKRLLHRSLPSAGASDCRLRLLGKIVPTNPLRSVQGR
jgi:hypothetical protein